MLTVIGIMENSELQVGRYTQAEIAAWMGIHPVSFSRAKEKKRKELAYFCDFDLKDGYYIVTEVRVPLYERHAQKNFNIVKKAFPAEWEDGGMIDQCSNVAVKIQKHHKELDSSPRTTYNYTLKSKKEYIKEGRYVESSLFAVKKGENGEAEYRNLTEKETEIVKGLIKVFFGGKDVEEVLLLQMLDEGEITEKEFSERMREVKRFSGATWLEFLAEAKNKLRLGDNEKLQRVTQLGKSAF